MLGGKKIGCVVSTRQGTPSSYWPSHWCWKGELNTASIIITITILIRSTFDIIIIIITTITNVIIFFIINIIIITITILSDYWMDSTSTTSAGWWYSWRNQTDKLQRRVAYFHLTRQIRCLYFPKVINLFFWLYIFVYFI